MRYWHPTYRARVLRGRLRTAPALVQSDGRSKPQIANRGLRVRDTKEEVLVVFRRIDTLESAILDLRSRTGNIGRSTACDTSTQRKCQCCLAHHIESDLRKEATTENHITAVLAMIYTLSRSEEQPQTWFAGADRNCRFSTFAQVTI